MYASPLLQSMTGHGELWVDEAGLPRRQILDIAIPGINERYDSQSHMVIDFNFKDTGDRGLDIRYDPGQVSPRSAAEGDWGLGIQSPISNTQYPISNTQYLISNT